MKIKFIFATLHASGAAGRTPDAEGQKQTIYYPGEVADVPDAQAKAWVREGRAEPAPKAAPTGMPA